MAVSKKPNIDDKIERLKEQRDKKEQGLDYRVDNIFAEEKAAAAKKAPAAENVKAHKGANPYVRKVTLTELINVSRLAKGQKPLGKTKQTPFINRQKEIKTPQLDRKSM